MGSKILALAGAILLILCFPYQQYNSFLYTESVFFSLSVIYTCFLIEVKKPGLREGALIILFLILLCITRPSGIFIIAATIIYLFFVLSNSIPIWKKSLLFVSLAAIAIWLLNAMMGSGGQINILLPFSAQMIICEVPTNVLGLKNTSIQTDNSIAGLLNYIVNNPKNFLKLGMLKMQAFFGLTRSFYSPLHNIFLIFYYYSLYVLTFLAIIIKNRQLPIGFIYLLSLVGFYALSVVFSCDEWGNRFFVTLTPFLIILGLYAFVKTPKS